MKVSRVQGLRYCVVSSCTGQRLTCHPGTCSNFLVIGEVRTTSACTPDFFTWLALLRLSDQAYTRKSPVQPGELMVGSFDRLSQAHQ